MHHLVRYSVLLRWQHPVSHVALHLRRLLGELPQHALPKRGRYFEAAPGFLHGLAHGIPFHVGSPKAHSLHLYC